VRGAGNLNVDVHDVRVENSDVIRTEHKFDGMEQAVFSAHQGGKGTLKHYLFDDLRVENASFRLLSLAVRPSPFSGENAELARIDDLLFRNISVSDPQSMPDLLQSYDRQHQLSNVRFENVVVAGTVLPERPTITFNANRTMSVGGNATYDPLWRNIEDPTSFQTLVIDSAAAPRLQCDFDQNGYSDILLRDAQGAVEILSFGRDSAPGSTDFEPSQFFADSTSFYNQHWKPVSGVFDSSWVLAGVGDSRGVGYAGILWYRPSTGDLGLTAFSAGFRTAPRSGRVRTGQIFVKLASDQALQVSAPGDFDANGTYDVLLYHPATGLGSILYLNSQLPDFFRFGTGSISVTGNWQLLR